MGWSEDMCLAPALTRAALNSRKDPSLISPSTFSLISSLTQCVVCLFLATRKDGEERKLPFSGRLLPSTEMFCSLVV